MTPYYEHAGITIYHGNSSEILPTISGIDCIVTSPPYNQLGSRMSDKPRGLWADSHGGAGFVKMVQEQGYADDMEETAYQAWQNDLFVGIQANESCSLFYNHQLRWRDKVLLHPVKWFNPKGWDFRQELIWDRCAGMMLNARMFARSEERILWFDRGKHKFNEGCAGDGSVWRLSPEHQQQGKHHPVAFPIEIPLRLIRATTDPGDLVVDPFMGGATTLRAAKDLGRRAIGIELEERFCEVAAKRMGQEVFEFATT